MPLLFRTHTPIHLKYLILLGITTLLIIAPTVASAQTSPTNTDCASWDRAFNNSVESAATILLFLTMSLALISTAIAPNSWMFTSPIRRVLIVSSIMLVISLLLLAVLPFFGIFPLSGVPAQYVQCAGAGFNFTPEGFFNGIGMGTPGFSQTLPLVAFALVSVITGLLLALLVQFLLFRFITGLRARITP